MTVVCYLLGIFCFVYYAVIISVSGITADAAFVWPCMGTVLLILGMLIQYDKKHPGSLPAGLKVCFGCLIGAGLLVFLICFCLILSGMRAGGEDDLDYVVVLGAQVRGDVPSRALRRRLEKADAYAVENPDTILVLTGGQGTGENISEAECMRRYLTEHGIPEDRLILEDRSTSTRENLVNADLLTGCMGKRTGILSNNFHIYRAVKMAEKMGYQKVCGIAADSVPSMQLQLIVREVMALIKAKITGGI